MFNSNFIPFAHSDIVCKERLKTSKHKYLNVIFKEIDHLILNQNSAVEGVKFQNLFEDRFPYNELRLKLLTDRQRTRLRKIFCDRKPFG